MYTSGVIFFEFDWIYLNSLLEHNSKELRELRFISILKFAQMMSREQPMYANKENKWLHPLDSSVILDPRGCYRYTKQRTRNNEKGRILPNS